MLQQIYAKVGDQLYAFPTHIQSYVESYIISILEYPTYFTLGYKEDFPNEEAIEISSEELKKVTPDGFEDSGSGSLL